mmetsp:Transcript_6774/g.9890  ORF Transcript_6774/g.9890 Transcript_6774/m.9890 type:complete len:338 (+) Transcript_6774:91-1104(+)
MTVRLLLRYPHYWLPGLAGLDMILNQNTRPFLISVSTLSSCDPVQVQKMSDAKVPKPSWAQIYLASWNLSRLPFPRRLTPLDPAFRDEQMKRGLRQRDKDERRLRELQLDVQRAHKDQNKDSLRKLFEKVTEIAYGKGVTAQMREDFLARYGCTGWNQEILVKLVKLGKERGIVEIGAGHGQWARALSEYYEKIVVDKAQNFDFVLAYDDMTSLPLSTKIYHEHTQTSHDFFFNKVRHCKEVKDVLRQWVCRGRLLLMVFPPPGSMALSCVKAYTEMGAENDIFIYVGEGRGGSTADDAFFDYMENGDWVLLDIMKVETQPGGKGFEKLYIFQHLPK